MVGRPRQSTRIDIVLPDTTPFRCGGGGGGAGGQHRQGAAAQQVVQAAARGVAQARDFVAGEDVEAAARVDAGVDGGKRGGARGRGGVVNGGHPVVCLVLVVGWGL